MHPSSLLLHLSQEFDVSVGCICMYRDEVLHGEVR